MKYLALVCGGLCVLGAHAAIDLEVINDQGVSTIPLEENKKTIMYTVSNSQGDQADLWVTLIKENASTIALSFVTQVTRVDKSTKSSHPITVELTINETTPIQFDIVHGGVFMNVTPRKK